MTLRQHTLTTPVYTLATPVIPADAVWDGVGRLAARSRPPGEFSPPPSRQGTPLPDDSESLKGMLEAVAAASPPAQRGSVQAQLEALAGALRS